jgi:hypothetical protein
MTDSNTAQKSELVALAVEINDLAAQLSAFKPVLVEINDSIEISSSAYGQLELIASLSEYINRELSNIAVRLQVSA